MTISTAYQVWQDMKEATKQGSIRNYTTKVDMQSYTVTTELFSQMCLDAYSAWNLEQTIKPEWQHLFSEAKGGAQGDYREGMASKIDNVVDCLTKYPKSKRAVITISNNPAHHHSSTTDAKCLREVHFYIEEGKLNATALFRAQAATIFPKNIHFLGKLMDEIAERLPGTLITGELFYLATILVGEREL